MGETKNYVILSGDCHIQKPATKDASLIAIDKIKQDMTDHIGQYALYYRQEKQCTVSMLVKIEGIYPHFVRVSYECYAPDGRFRQYLYDYVNWSILYCRDEALKFIDDI